MASPEEYKDNSVEAERAADGTSDYEAAHKRREMKDSTVDGGGAGDGKPQGNLRVADDADTSNEPAATARAAQKPDADKPDSSVKSLPFSQKAGLAVKGLFGNKKALITIASTGGIIGLILALFLGFANLKLIHMMENMNDHFFDRNHHMFEERKRAIYREYFNHYFGPDGAAIDDNTASLTQQLMRGMKDGLEPRLREKYDISVRYSFFGGTRYKVVEFTDKNTGEKYTFDTSKDDGQAREFVDQVSADITHDDGWYKRKWIRFRLRKITGTNWHWLDPIKKPYTEAKRKAATQVVGYLLSDKSPASGLSASLIEKFLGGDLKDAYTEGSDQAAQAAVEGTAEVTAKQLVEKITATVAKVSGPQLALTAIDLACRINSAIDDKTIQKIAQKKAEVEYMTTYSAWASKASQLKAGKTDAITVGANMSLLTSTDDKGRAHDISESHNYQRATGQKVDYKENSDCDTTTELCDSKVPSKRLEENTVFKALGAVADVHNNRVFKILTSLPPLSAIPISGSYSTDAMCKVVNTGFDLVGSILGFLGSSSDAVVSSTPGIKEIYNPLKENGQKVIGELTGKVFEAALPPIVDSATRGPALANAVAAGASMSADSAAGGIEGIEDTNSNGSVEDASCHNKQDRADESYCGRKLSKSEITSMDTQIALEHQEELKNASAMTKIASFTDPSSVLSRMITATPASPKVALQRSSHSIASIFNPAAWARMAKAATTGLTPQALAADGQSSFVVSDDGTDQFGVPVHGFTDAELNSTDNLDNPEYENITRNVGCSMIAGLKDDKGEDINQPTACDTSSGDEAEDSGDSSVGDIPSGDTQELAKQILDNKNITFQAGNRGPFEQAAAGKASSITCTDGSAGGKSSAVLSSDVLKILLVLADNYKFAISASTNACHTNGSDHYAGKAVDIGSVGTGAATLGKIQEYVYSHRDDLPNPGQLIYLGPSHHVNHQLNDGKPAPDSTYSDHQDHAHIGVK